MTDLSIIIPTFNRLWSLPEAVASCRLNQCSLEIIVVDDGSTDGTVDWLKTQSDIVSVSQENWGKGYAVNRGLALAKGEYIRFLDSDDMLPAQVNDLQLAAARAAKADVVVAGHIVRDELRQSDRVSPWVACDDFIAQQLGECDSSHYSAYLFRREFIADLPHRQEFAMRDDRMFVMEMAMRNPEVVAVAESCLIHRHHVHERIQFGRGMASVVTSWQEYKMFKKIEAQLQARGMLTARRKKALVRSLWPLAHRVAQYNIAEAAGVVRWCKTLDPDFVIPRSGIFGKIYGIFGFRCTQMMIRCIRYLRDMYVVCVAPKEPYVPQ